MDKPIIGQLVQDINGKNWNYAVVVNVFDNKYETISQNGYITMVVLEDMDEDYVNRHINKNGKTELLFKNGKPVMAKKTLFGRYKFEPVNQ